MNDEKSTKPGVMMYWETFTALEDMAVGDAVKMLKAIRNYAQYGVEPDFEEGTTLRMAWYFVRGRIDDDNSRYERTRQANSEKGKKSGEVRRQKSQVQKKPFTID